MLASCLAAGLTSIRALLATDSHGLHKHPRDRPQTAPRLCAKCPGFNVRWTARNGSERRRSAPCQPTRLSWFVPEPRCCRRKTCPSLVFLPSSAALSPPLSYYIRAIRHHRAQKSRGCAEPLGATLSTQTPRASTYVTFVNNLRYIEHLRNTKGENDK